MKILKVSKINGQKEKLNSSLGITLVALVVTIVVLLILAGVSINMVLGENGLIAKAKKAKNTYSEAAKNDQALMDSLYDEMGEYLGYKSVNGVKIPVGFYYVGGTKDSGLVISDNIEDENRYEGQEVVGIDLEGNQFVWIPVNYDNFHLIEGYSNGELKVYLSADTNPSREAGSTMAAGNPLNKNNTTGTAESIAMYQSVKNNGGFYIARYEAGINGTAPNHELSTKIVADGTIKPLSKAGLGVWNSIAWGGTDSDTASDGLQGNDTADGAVKVARNMYTRTENCGVTSTLCYGVQWNATMQFIDNNYVKGTCTEDSFVRDSSNNGNYSGRLKKTGQYAVKNIYDLAGNVWEWTMEAYGSNTRIFRGGYVYNGYEDPASRRGRI